MTSTSQSTSPAANVEFMRAAFQAFNAGRTVEYVSHEFYRIADGLVAEEWICSDMATLLQQLS